MKIFKFQFNFTPNFSTLSLLIFHFIIFSSFPEIQTDLLNSKSLIKPPQSLPCLILQTLHNFAFHLKTRARDQNPNSLSLSLSRPRAKLPGQMPFWWGRKPTKNKQRQHPQGGYPDTSESSINNDSKKRANDKRNTGSDDVVFVSTISPLKNSGSSGSSSDGSLAFSGFDSGRSQPIPLQRPSGMGHRGGYGFGSGSVSSVSSSGSSDDRTPDLGHFRTLRLVGALFFGFDSSNDTYKTLTTTPDTHMCIERARI